MKENFLSALKQVLVYEGGYVNNPNDPGGATNKGVTQAVYNQWRLSLGEAKQSVKFLTSQEVQRIYKNNYWDKVKGDQLADGVDLATFDLAVNSGVSRAIKMLQKAVGVTVDGIIGPATIAAANKNPVATTKALCDARLAFLQGLPTWKFFGKGWANRVASVKKLSTILASSDQGNNNVA
jgi:lysozyme family protein